MDEIPVTILSRFDEIYQKLMTEESRVIPARDAILDSIRRCSFKMFEEPEDYLGNERAKEHEQYISTTFGTFAFRVYYNAYSDKVYVDLNRESISAIRISMETETQVLIDILRSILVVDPAL